jgi:hypothetical protein
MGWWFELYCRKASGLNGGIIGILKVETVYAWKYDRIFVSCRIPQFIEIFGRCDSRATRVMRDNSSIIVHIICRDSPNGVIIKWYGPG